MPLTVDQFLSVQREAIFSDFRDGGVTCLISTTSERLVHHSKQYHWSISNLNGVKATSALVVRKRNSEPELWVRVSYRGYRQAYAQFLNQYYGLRAVSIPASLQVDHLHPTSRFTSANEGYFIRLALIDRGINASYGAGFERLMYSRERERELVGGIHMDWMAFFKVVGSRVPSKLGGEDSWRIWAWQQAEIHADHGFDTILTYVGLTTMLNLAFCDVWQPLSPHPSFRAKAEKHSSYSCVPQLSKA